MVQQSWHDVSGLPTGRKSPLHPFVQRPAVMTNGAAAYAAIANAIKASGVIQAKAVSIPEL
jgi:hypothetical protein